MSDILSADEARDIASVSEKVSMELDYIGNSIRQAAECGSDWVDLYLDFYHEKKPPVHPRGYVRIPSSAVNVILEKLNTLGYGIEKFNDTYLKHLYRVSWRVI